MYMVKVCQSKCHRYGKRVMIKGESPYNRYVYCSVCRKWIKKYLVGVYCQCCNTKIRKVSHAHMANNHYKKVVA